MDNIKRWYTFNEYYDEEGVQIPEKIAKINYTIVEKRTIIKTNGNKGYKHVWNACKRSEQLRLFES